MKHIFVSIFFTSIASFAFADDVDITGEWLCLMNNKIYSHSLDINYEKGRIFTGRDTVISGPCCVGVESEINGEVDSDGTISFSRKNSDLVSPQLYRGNVESQNEMRGVFSHLGAGSFTWECSR